MCAAGSHSSFDIECIGRWWEGKGDVWRLLQDLAVTIDGRTWPAADEPQVHMPADAKPCLLMQNPACSCKTLPAICQPGDQLQNYAHHLLTLHHRFNDQSWHCAIWWTCTSHSRRFGTEGRKTLITCSECWATAVRHTQLISSKWGCSHRSTKQTANGTTAEVSCLL